MPDTKKALPRTWTRNVEAMGGDAEWGPDGMSTIPIKEQGLNDPKPVLGSSSASGNALFYFTSDGKLYLFNAFDSSVSTVKKPTTVEAVVDLIVQGKQKEIELEKFKGHSYTI
ncbi:hypothetical protein FGADI_10096 [Fusarium gaditjirri]|uniref:Uncharacterized protein n=1 Tax=Fusarium gaditjirri TaxID=282569 RepID=A0A8H4SYD6_9HYPO|nr:hypothetical protein FGADI_10096 [Fusarium gaditjirri]